MALRTALGQFRRELGHVGQLRAETGLAGWRVTFRGGRVVTSPARVGAHFLSFDNGTLVLRFLPLSGNSAPNYPEFVLPWGTNWGASWITNLEI